MRTLPILPFESAFPEPFAVLAPHPDDESLGCGGVIAEACDRHRPPMVIILTDGTGSHPGSRLYPPERLRALRQSETLAATACLGLPADRVRFLAYRDTAAPSDGAALHEAAGHVARLAEASGCRTLLAPWRHDPHCDHQAAAAIAQAASRMANLRLLSYPVWGLTLPPATMLPDESFAGFRLDIAHHLHRKRAAIAAHRSQYAGIIPDDPTGFQMQQPFIELFLQQTEIFIGAADRERYSA